MIYHELGLNSFGPSTRYFDIDYFIMLSLEKSEVDKIDIITFNLQIRNIGWVVKA